VFPDVAIVAIGRNEGERLRRCLQSAVAQARIVVYVDSGSTDDSKVIAQKSGAHVLDLDLSQPFTAARGRNAGFRWICEHHPDINFVQFVDGDCEINQDWIGHAHHYLNSHQDVVATFGRRRERSPNESVYNQLCDWEWDISPGEVSSCGGDVLIRRSALEAIDGYRDHIIAGEEPEMCFRLRANGWKIHCIAAEMTLHDAKLLHFSQWCKRMSRSGYAYALGTSLYGKTSERYWVKETIRPWMWVLVPLAACIGACAKFGPIGLIVLSIYLLQVTRLALRDSHLPTFQARFTKASFDTLSRFPELLGQLRFLRDQMRGHHEIIEYK